MPKRRKSEYAKAVADAERETRFFVARQLKATVPDCRVKLAQDISELQLAWRDMNDKQKQMLIAETIRKAKGFVQMATPPQPTRADVDGVWMTPEERAECEGRYHEWQAG